MKVFTEEMKELARKLFDVGAVDCVNMHTLKLHANNPKAPLSPIFFNLRTPDNPKPGPLTQEIVHEIAKLLKTIMDKENGPLEFVAPVPNAADPFVKELARLIPNGESKVLYLTKEGEDKTRRVGPLTEESKQRVLIGKWVDVVDDLVTRAESKLEAIYELEDAGLLIRNVVVLIDREQGGKEDLAKEGYTLSSVFTLSEILKFYLEEKLISREKYEQICDYVRENS